VLLGSVYGVAQAWHSALGQELMLALAPPEQPKA